MYRAYKLIGVDLNPRRSGIASSVRRVRKVWPCTFVRAGQDGLRTQEMVAVKVGPALALGCYSTVAGLGA